ncbi:MAG: D-aminoacyl-tRNA deacylase [Candidatus Anoxychlamydiales bacterium]|uniref:D-aminoacyl-tRNA deacylase n=1 Tax=marine sediment metagenome TaxID=412755 RepID=A0A0F9H952_9ZZZZ|nr:D-aminoacyl-tRNA deacylase [Candidatus Anoxychlamydiales bacterium]NGX40623.1 D-aminoacyl-tRNA deacylase [Candidatus Anoxychlamydiales bacterium]HEU64722.1 D-tyrosyl-tRNA(Tyr) deacylase [Chlamydiota bacterium]
MRAVIQRVKEAKVEVDQKIVGQINQGILVLFGCHKDDIDNQIDYLVDKIVNMRIFSDEDDKMNLSIKDISGDILVVSQFTLLADTKKGRRPSFINSMEPKKANEFYEKFISKLKENIKKVQTGIFGAKMQIFLINDGPVTFILDL